MLAPEAPQPTSSGKPLVTGQELRVPEILAPAGGRAQFFAALHAGADAVYLGLKEFNARSRAENFSIADLRELVPLAHHFGMKVLVTLNIIIKEAELPRLVEHLVELELTGIDAVIVQDLGVARLIRERFPGLRLHASTQLAVHNLHGVVQAMKLGFKRVVLARELTAQELRLIRQAIPRELVEIEAFCHGSLCYSYSGLCFFSGAADARSGNRGECAYTCRKPYKVLNEPGHGFLFSMKDLNTSNDLEKLVEAGVDTLKIEGRKKDAQYVATAVGLYRKKLDEIFGYPTAATERGVNRDFHRDMNFSYHRDTTSFFVKGRYHENVIDLGNPTHKGLFIGKVTAVHGRFMELTSKEPLERYDGLRIDRPVPLYHAKPQHGAKAPGMLDDAKRKYANEVCQFSLRNFTCKGERIHASKPGQKVRIDLPENLNPPTVGDLVYKVRSNELKRHTESLNQPPSGYRLRQLTRVDLAVNCESDEETIQLTLAASLAGETLNTFSITFPAEKPHSVSTLQEDLQESLTLIGDLGLQCRIKFTGDFSWFLPRRNLKQIKSQLLANLENALAHWQCNKKQQAVRELTAGSHNLTLKPASNAEICYQIKCDRLATIAALSELHSKERFPISEVIFEPKRAFLGQVKAADCLQELLEKTTNLGAQFRLALPTVLRAWDEPLLKTWLVAAKNAGINAFEIGNLGALPLLSKAGFNTADLDLASDFTLYALNSRAVKQLKELGCQRVALSVEDDRENIFDKLRNWPEGTRPQAILYKDTPLFIAEACSLTALHRGCPTAKVCGYRTLEVENDAGEHFFVAHESCKSIVYGAEAFAISQFRKELAQTGVKDFRIDFLTRPYEPTEVKNIITACRSAAPLPRTHPANYLQRLL